MSKYRCNSCGDPLPPPVTVSEIEGELSQLVYPLDRDTGDDRSAGDVAQELSDLSQSHCLACAAEKAGVGYATPIEKHIGTGERIIRKPGGWGG